MSGRCQTCGNSDYGCVCLKGSNMIGPKRVICDKCNTNYIEGERHGCSAKPYEAHTRAKIAFINDDNVRSTLFTLLDRLETLEHEAEMNEVEAEMKPATMSIEQAAEDFAKIAVDRDEWRARAEKAETDCEFARRLGKSAEADLEKAILSRNEARARAAEFKRVLEMWRTIGTVSPSQTTCITATLNVLKNEDNNPR